MDKFLKVPVEEDTTILEEKQITIKGVCALLQEWVWDGIKGSSLIFEEEDVKTLTDTEIKTLTSGIDESEGQMTLARNQGYVFVNFNFKY